MKRFSISALILGVAIAFFLIAGFGLAGYPFYLLLQGAPPGLRDWSLPVNAGLLFLTFGAAILTVNLRAVRKRREQERLVAELSAPCARKPRLTGAIPTRTAAIPWASGFIAWVWNLFSALMAQIALITPKLESGSWVVLAIWSLAGLAMVPILAYGVIVA